MMDIVLCEEFGQFFLEGGAVICDDFVNCSPSGDDILEDKPGDSSRVVGCEHSELRVCCQGVPGLYDVSIVP